MIDITGGTTSCMFKTYKREKQRLNKKNRPADHVAQDPVSPRPMRSHGRAAGRAGSGQGRAHSKAEGVKAVEHVVLETLRPRQDRGQPHVPKPGTHYRLHQL